MINSYSFGRITINGKVYTSDIIIFPDGSIQDSWRRKEGHILATLDIINLIEANPQLIIVGTGASNLMKVKNEIPEILRTKGIQLKILPTEQAVKLYNETYQNQKTGACFHLTC